MALKGTCRRRSPWRCNRKKCQIRFTLKREPIEPPKCPACGGACYNTKKHLAKDREKEDTCRCSGVPFPHRRSTVIGCDYWEGEWNDETEYRYKKMWETARYG